MIVCVCNGLSERDVRSVVERHEVIGVGDVYRRLGCRVSCGKCVPYVAAYVHAARRAEVIAPARHAAASEDETAEARLAAEAA